MLVAFGELVPDPVAVPVGQLRLDESALPTLAAEGGGIMAGFCAWARRFGSPSRFITATDGDARTAHLLAELAGAGVEACPVRSIDEADGCLDGARLLYIEARSLISAELQPIARRVLEAARGRGAQVAVEVSGTEWIRANGAPRTAYQLATLRPDLLFINRAAADELAVPMEGIAAVPVIGLGVEGCSVYGRVVPAPTGAPPPAGRLAGAFAAAFCVAYLDGAAPLEAAGRAVLAGGA